MLNPRVIVKDIKDSKEYILLDTLKMLELPERYSSFGDAWFACHKVNIEHQPEYIDSEWGKIVGNDKLLVEMLQQENDVIASRNK